MITPASQCHVIQMAVAGLRDDDVQEVRAASGLPPGQALQESFRLSSLAWVLLDKGSACAMWGVVPSPVQSVGIPWLLATDAFNRLHNQKQLLRSTKHYVNAMGHGFKYLINFTDVRHTQSHRWLKWAGFTFDAPVPFGHEQRPFFRFFKET